MPEYRVLDARSVKLDGTEEWEVTCRVENAGTGRMPVEIAAVRGERFPDPEDEAALEAAEPWREARVTVEPAAGESVAVTIRTPFEPASIVVDPDARVLMLERKRAEFEL